MFPKMGIVVTVPRTQQPPETCVDSQNVRARDSIDGRSRGGLRPGHSRYVNTTFGGGTKIQDINYSTIIANSAPAANTLSYRQTAPMAIANGTVYAFTAPNTVTAATVGGARTLSNTVPFIFSSELFQRIYIVDGTSYKIWIASNNTTTDWTPTAGSLPGTDGTVAPRLIEMWRSRIVLSGLRTDPHNWFMSRLGDPLDWEYAPASTTETQPVQGGVGVVGKLGDVINSIIPYSDDICIFGCDHSIWQLAGDPQAGGRMDLISGTIGMAFGRPYCQDSTGTIYFLTSRGSVCTMRGGGSPLGTGGNPVSITEDSIDPLLTNTNLNTTYVRMVWDEEQNGAYLYLTPFLNSASTVWFYDAKNKGWFKDAFSNTNVGPTSVKAFDGDLPGDRVVLLGGRDGYIRYVNVNSVYDDNISNYAIGAYVIIGPTMAEDGKKPFILTELQALTDSSSNTIKYEILTGDTPDAALDTASVAFTADGSWGAGMGSCENPRVRGYYIYYKIGSNSATTSWAIERVRSKIQILKNDFGRARLADLTLTYTDDLDIYTSGAIGFSGLPYSTSWLFYGGTSNTDSQYLLDQGGSHQFQFSGSSSFNTTEADILPDTGTHVAITVGSRSLFDLGEDPFIKAAYDLDNVIPSILYNSSLTNFILEFSMYGKSSTTLDDASTFTTSTGQRRLIGPYLDVIGNTGIYVDGSKVRVRDTVNTVNQLSDQSNVSNFLGSPFRRFFIRVSGSNTNIWVDGVQFTHTSGNANFTTPPLFNGSNIVGFFSGDTALTSTPWALKYVRIWGGVNNTTLNSIIAEPPPSQSSSIWNV